DGMFLIRDRGFRPISLAIARASPESRHRFLASRHCASLVVCPILRVLLDAVRPQRTILALPGPPRSLVFFRSQRTKSHQTSPTESAHGPKMATETTHSTRDSPPSVPR